MDMHRFNLVVRTRSRHVWKDPMRKVRALESFSRTESDGGRDILAAIKHVRDPKLHECFQRHAEDELEHGELFRRRARELRAGLADPSAAELDRDRLFDLSRNRPDLATDSHGFLSGDRLDEVGEIAYVAMLHVAERRAAAMFRLHHEFTADDLETNAIFKRVLKDEQYHVAYTGNYLERWRREGRGREVKESLSRARASRIFGAWKRLGARAGANFGRMLMGIAYFTIAVPFALIAKSGSRGGWRESMRGAVLPRVRSQY